MGMITSIEESRGVYTLYVDGVAFARIKKKYFEQIALSQGDELDEQAYQDRLSALQFKDAYESALTLLTARDMTAHDLTSALCRRGYTGAAAQAVCERLQENRLIDDARYAQRYVELHRDAQTGRYALRRKMRAKGLDEQLVDGLLDEHLDDGSQLEAARALGQKLARRYEGEDPRKTRARLSQALARRGFSWDTIHQALEDLASDEED